MSSVAFIRHIVNIATDGKLEIIPIPMQAKGTKNKEMYAGINNKGTKRL